MWAAFAKHISLNPDLWVCQHCTGHERCWAIFVRVHRNYYFRLPKSTDDWLHVLIASFCQNNFRQQIKCVAALHGVTYLDMHYLPRWIYAACYQNAICNYICCEPIQQEWYIVMMMKTNNNKIIIWQMISSARHLQNVEIHWANRLNSTKSIHHQQMCTNFLSPIFASTNRIVFLRKICPTHIYLRLTFSPALDRTFWCNRQWWKFLLLESYPIRWFVTVNVSIHMKAKIDTSFPWIYFSNIFLIYQMKCSLKCYAFETFSLDFFYFYENWVILVIHVLTWW